MRAQQPAPSAGPAPADGAAPRAPPLEGVSEIDVFAFDTLGYLVVRGVLSPAEVAEVNGLIDANLGRAHERKGGLRLTSDSSSSSQQRGSRGRMDLGGALDWGGDVCRSILAHRRLMPYLHAFVGRGYRLDHQPLVIIQDKGAEGFDMHGGAIDDGNMWDPYLSYQVAHGTVRTNLLGVSLQLVDTQGSTDGGFCIIPGSHKSNFRCPAAVKKMQYPMSAATQEQQPLTVSPSVRAGDVILFSEACTHGTLAWKSDRQRRIVLYRFSPANLAYGRNYSDPDGGWDRETLRKMTGAQRSIVQPPFHPRLDRQTLAAPAGGAAVAASVPRPRSDEKKDFDKRVFGTTYF